MDNYNHISLQGGGQDSEANVEEEGEDARASALYQAVCDIAREGEGWIDF